MQHYKFFFGTGTISYFSIEEITSNFKPFLFNSSTMEVFPNAAPGGRTPPLKRQINLLF